MNLNESVYLARHQKIESAMREAGLNALVVYGNGSALGPASQSHGYMTFLCGWDSHTVPSALITRPGNAPILVVPHVFLSRLAKETMWLDTRFCLPGTLGQAVAGILNEGTARPNAERSFAILGRNEIPVGTWEQMTSRLAGVRFIDFSTQVDPLRLIKTDVQIAMHQRAADLCDELFALLGSEIRSGKPVYRIQADLEHHARCAGAEFFQSWLTVMPVADYCRTYREECLRVPQPGDQVLLGLYIILDGHWGHAVRTGVIGAPTPAQREVYAIARDMFDKALSALAPGRDLKDAEAAAQDVFQTRFPGPAQREAVFRFRTGHALGHSYEDPIATAPFPQPYGDDFGQVAKGNSAAPVVAQPGMLLEVHPNLFARGMGGACIGDMVLLGEHGHRLLTKHVRDLLVY